MVGEGGVGGCKRGVVKLEKRRKFFGKGVVDVVPVKLVGG